MPVKSYKPTSPGRRGMTVSSFADITKEAPEKSLTAPLRSTGGRNSYGRITTRFRGGGVKRRYRIIDFKRDKDAVPAKVASIEYDPNRSARIALLHYADGEKRYILAPLGVGVGDTLVSGSEADIKPGNALPLANIPVGTVIHNIELYPGRGAQLCRSAGTAAQLMAREGRYATVRLPSGEFRMILAVCKATIGQVGNVEHENVEVGKAGKTRYFGRRPHNRGVVMNPVDHPHGGGEGKAPVGHPGPLSPWGKPTLGARTRSKKNKSDKLIVRRRKR